MTPHSEPTTMRFEQIACLDDLLRDAGWWAREFFYDLVRGPIHMAAGLDIAQSPRRMQRHNLKWGFDAELFRTMCGLPARTWHDRYHTIPDDARDYLVRHLPPQTLFIGYEMPVWLRDTLDGAGATWLDIRLSPLRFGSDLYIGLASNDASLREVLSRHAMSAATVLGDACLMSARVRHRTRYRPDHRALDGHVIYIGQTEDDAALLDEQGRCVRVAQFGDALAGWVGDAPVLYKPHPLTQEFAEQERLELERLLGRRVPRCEADTYDMLAGDDEVRFIALSSGVAQEAEWFGKASAVLYQPLCTPAFGLAGGPGEHLMVAAHDFLGEPLWADLLDLPVREDAFRPPPVPNRLRELHNTWWGYASYTLRDNHYYREAFRLHGGGAAAGSAGDAGALAQQLAVERQRVDDLRLELDGLKEALRVLMRHGRTREPAPWTLEASDA